uniref:Uncharacterized protein n=1 Tax=Conchiformibius kuhniae TaxID=211502 RepID=A0A8T9MTT8_9NEIS|nr:hypothetical protein LVJ77_01395 [Conchiformibius kuhniae]
MDRKRAIIIWVAMVTTIALIAYLLNAPWWLAILIGVAVVERHCRRCHRRDVLETEKTDCQRRPFQY